MGAGTEQIPVRPPRTEVCWMILIIDRSPALLMYLNPERSSRIRLCPSAIKEAACASNDGALIASSRPVITRTGIPRTHSTCAGTDPVEGLFIQESY